MCQRGEAREVVVKVPADLAAEGLDTFKLIPIDECIADIVEALQEGCIDMRGSCCGHGETVGDIELQDGRVLLVLDKEQGQEWMAADLQERRRLMLALV